MTTTRPEHPNLVLIVLDQLRFDSLGLSSGGRVATPNIDALTHRGVRFENAFNHLPTCCPSRQSLMTGRRPEAFGAHWNFDITLPIPSITPEVPTWTADLSRAGYRSSYLGKWHVSEDHVPTEFGYDEYVGQGDYEAFRTAKYPEFGPLQGWEAGVDPVELADTETHWFSALASERIVEYANGDGPWHVRLDLVQPHLPCRPVEEFANRYDPSEIEPWPSFGDTFEQKPYIQRQQLNSWGIEDWTWDDWAPVVARYFGIIGQIDDALGLVFDALRRSGQEEDTLVILTTDHGDMCGAHRMMDKHYVLYDDVIHVPLIAAWPGQIAPGGIRSELVYNVLDLVPTLTETLGLPLPEGSVGRSLWPLLSGEGAPDGEPWRSEIVATFNGQQFGLYTARAIRTDEWKYVWNATDIDELYNLRNDPAELHNVIRDTENEKRITELRARLYETLLREGDRQVDNEWVRRQLLGGAIL